MREGFAIYLQMEEERIKAEKNRREQWKSEMPIGGGIPVRT